MDKPAYFCLEEQSNEKKQLVISTSIDLVRIVPD